MHLPGCCRHPTSPPATDAQPNPASSQVTGQRAFLTGAAGTVPAVAIMDRYMRAPLLLLPMGPASQGPHSASEHIERDIAGRGLAVACAVLQGMGGVVGAPRHVASLASSRA